MKDYKLSEIKAMCKDCNECEINEFECAICFGNIVPEDWHIDKEQPKDKIESLADTIELMTSADYKDRFKAEYYQLKIRYEKLNNMVKNWDNLSFTPTCTKQIYNLQLAGMSDYLQVLETRAEIEGIKLN